MYPRKYQKDFPQKLIEHMSNGSSFESFGAKVGVGKSALYKWLDKYKAFSDAKEIAELKALQYFEQRLIALSAGQKVEGFTPKLCSERVITFALQTRFHKIYGHKIDHSSDDGTMSPKETKVIVIPSNGREAKQ